MIAYYKLLDYINRMGMNKEEFRKWIGISPATMAKIGKNEYISLGIIDKICEKTGRQPGDFIEYYEKAIKNPQNTPVRISIKKTPIEEDPNETIIDVKEIPIKN